MQVKLKVLQGGKTGTEIPVRVEQLIIGRGEDCQLRANSDKISRHHCAITVDGDRVSIRDLGSRNGTVVNDVTIQGDCELKAGDRILVGPLSFELLIDAAAGSEAPPASTVPKPAATGKQEPGSKGGGKVNDLDVSSWLETEDERDRTRRMADPETRQFKIDKEALKAAAEAADEARAKAEKEKEKEDSKSGLKKWLAFGQKDEKEYGKLPVQEQKAADSSTQAAQEMLEKFLKKGR